MLKASHLRKYVVMALGAILLLPCTICTVDALLPRPPPHPGVVPTPDDLVLDDTTFQYHGRNLTLSSPFEDWVAALGPPSYQFPVSEREPNWSSYIWDDLGVYINFRATIAGTQAVRELTIYLRSIDDPTLYPFKKESRLSMRTPQHGFPKRFFMEDALLEPGRDVCSKAIKDDIKAGVDYVPGRGGSVTYSPMAMVAKAKDGTVIRATADAFRVTDTPNHNCAGAFDAITFTSDEKWAN